MRIKVWCDNGMAGGERNDVIEVDDDATDEDIEIAVREWFFNFHEYGWEKVKDDK